ncbi:MAG TPA: HdeA/HdeB family chaperone [Stellaceae bacterium]|nr:HdeA/HdeB family chaperone [Stellaceae bacterium]
MLKSSVLAATMLLTISAANAEDLDFTKIKCSDFVTSPKDQVSIILAWLEGYYTKENDPPIIHMDKMTKDAKNLGTYCAAHGDDDIIKAADAVMPVK